MTHLVLNTWGTPNGRKPLLLLEELGVAYELVKIDIGQDVQKTTQFREKNLNARIPVLDTVIDGSTIAIAESAAILVHLAETHDYRFLPKEGVERARALQWTFFQMSGVGPMLGQLKYWRRQDVPNAAALERYLVETKRIYSVLDERLGQAPYLAGDEYGIADIATIFWARSPELLGLTLEPWPNVARWVHAIEARSAMQQTLAISFP